MTILAIVVATLASYVLIEVSNRVQHRRYSILLDMAGGICIGWALISILQTLWGW